MMRKKLEGIANIETALEIVGQMSTDDRLNFTPSKWREGVGLMVSSEEINVEEVLRAIEEIIEKG